MKIRTGFVSNSSSSSFVVLIPSGLDVDRFPEPSEEQYDWYDIEPEDRPEYFKKIKDSIRALQQGGEIWRDEDYYVFGLLEKLLEDYIVGSVSTGPDEGTIVGVSPKKKAKLKTLLGA